MRYLPALALAATALAAPSYAQPAPLERLPADVLDATPPSARVSGTPGRIAVVDRSCRPLPRDLLRRRIVDLAIQEWGYFGFSTVDETSAELDNRGRRRPGGWRRRRVDPQEAERVASTIAGYWSVTADGAWIVQRQNEIWRGPDGVARRWRYPWSAAFISWIMCEAGLAESAEFQRHIAHHVYIDQAIEARDGAASAARAAFTAYDVGEAAVEPGDLLCRARRGAYKTLVERRARLGDGVRSHCDIVVRLDPDNGRILVIGGNVRGSVRLKFLPAVADSASSGPGEYAEIGRNGRLIFAHLKLESPSIGHDALATSPTLEALRRDAAALAALERKLAETSSSTGVPGS